jgi:hypothetical protein
VLICRENVMGLEFPADWRFEGFEELPREAHWEFIKLVKMIARGADSPKAVFEEFKEAFGSGGSSSDAGWAESDMGDAMRSSMKNAALYVDSFYTAMKAVEGWGLDVPSVRKINEILAEHEVNLIVEPPELKLREGDIVLVDEDEESEEVLPLGFVQGEVIGAGGFGTVYRVTRKTKLGQYDYAMKVFDPSSFNSSKDRALKRFIRELHSLEQLQHRAIVPLLEAGYRKDQVPYILMPLIEGKDLRSALKDADAEKVLRVFDEILNGLEFAHEQGVLHRDLKPKNILVREVDEQPFILDFGAAFIRDEGDEELTTTLIGTDAYVPDEVRADPKHRTPHQDVYACGKLLYEVIMEKLPRLDDYDTIESTFDGFDGFDVVVKKAIAPERKRYQSISELRAALAELAE